MIGSTALGERLDPESLSLVMARYFAAMRAAIEDHGGTVAKFIGDAVMAVFGIPALHEDDALRAVRAASDMRAALAALNEDLERAYGVALLTRTGVNTGEVLIKDPTPAEGLVVGDAVNTAARLEQAAAPGEVLLGASTYALVRDAVLVDRVSPVVAKGKTEPLDAYRLVQLVTGAPGRARHFDLALVGRGREGALLEGAYRRAVTDQSCQLVTLLGPAGIGKSRLVAELVHALGTEAAVLTGRCLPYGQGITFWPIGEIVAQATGIRDTDSLEAARAKLRSAVGEEDHAEVVAARVGELIGLAPAASGPDESFWAVRSFLEALGRRGPLVVVLDDIQWAEPTLLDLIDHIVEWSRDVPLVLLCTSRPELVDTRREWGTGSNATTVVLQPLATAEVADLLANLAGKATVPESVSARIAEAAGGNPLFVEEMFAMLVDDGLVAVTDGSWVPTTDLASVPVPPTIAALLAARLDHLAVEERGVLQCASVVGEVFWDTAVAELASDEPEPDVGRNLQTLVRRELIRPERTSFAGEAFRFRHLLIRDASYAALPKADRAHLHERFTAWLERVAGERVGEYEAILGYHLEQACRLRAELGPAQETDLERARRGAAWLARAGRRSRDQGDDRSAAGLVERAVNLLPAADTGRAELLVELGRSLFDTGELDRAEAVLTEAVDATVATDDRCLHGRALLERMSSRIYTGSGLGPAEELAAAWLPQFTAQGDDRGLAITHRVMAWVWGNGGRHRDAQRSLELAWRHARQVGDTRQALDCLGSLRVAVNLGPTPSSEALRLFRGYATGVTSRLEQARTELAEAWALAMQGAVVEGRALVARSRATYQELGLVHEDAGSVQILYLVEEMALNAGGAADDLFAVARTLETMGETNIRATVLGMLADSLLHQGRDEEAEPFTRVSEELADPHDVDAQIRWRRARARLLARRGDPQTAEHLAREALDLVAATDALNDHASTLLDLAEVLRIAGRAEEASAIVSEAIVLYDRKENRAMAARARRLL